MSAFGSDICEMGEIKLEPAREWLPAADPAGSRVGAPRILILSDVRFIREALGEILRRETALGVVGVAADLDEAESVCRCSRPDIVLLDAGLPEGRAAVGRIRAAAPEASVVALAVAETDAAIILWAEAGVTGYVPRTAGMADLVAALQAVTRGEQACTARVAAGLLRRLAERARQTSPPATAEPESLTTRELEIVALLADGLSNKDIARRLDIAVATAKSHVHNLLQKLTLTRRGQAAAWLQRNDGAQARRS
jgi:two-component system, NarL family, nitrate/nitrite response regulator NarL